MGVLCLKCETSNKDKDDSEDNINEHKERNNELPKQYVNYIDFSEKTEGEETILKFENDEPTQKKIQNNNDDDKNKNKQNANILNKYAKAKSTKIKNKEQAEDNFEKIINEINEIKDEKPNENEYSGRKNKQFPTVVNPQELKNNLGENHKKASDELDLKKVNKSQRVVFQRRKKKSTTLMENSKILQQLFLAEMSIPISQELLVLQQKGNPSDKYIRGKKIGKGTFGTVYESKNIIFNNKVAMKIIPKDYHMDNLLIKNEIDILKKLSHPNIVRIYEFYESNNCFYIINEFCPEGELYDYINNSKLNEQQLAVIFYQVFSGLKYLHENNILHRDLKPENILISKKEKDLLDDEEYFWIQIIDFGTAKIFENDKNENSIVGSAYYIAPEVLNKDYN